MLLLIQDGSLCLGHLFIEIVISKPRNAETKGKGTIAKRIDIRAKSAILPEKSKEKNKKDQSKLQNVTDMSVIVAIYMPLLGVKLGLNVFLHVNKMTFCKCGTDVQKATRNLHHHCQT